VRVLVWHGFLLAGTGSNVYNARLCAALARQGHEIVLFSQERHANSLHLPANVRHVRPEIEGLLPVYVADRYEGVEARTYLEISDAEVERYLELNVAAVREVCDGWQPDVALANHLVMGPVVLARALGDDVPYAVKIHGSALEYVVKRDPERFLPYAREGLARARGVLVGSRHTAESLWAAMDDPELPARTRLGPPGVDVEEFRPMDDAPARVAALADVLEHEPPRAVESAFSRDAREAAAALRTLSGADRHVVFVGKLIVSKGVDLLAAAWPLVLAAVPEARLVVVGFGAYRPALERLLALLAAADAEGVRALAIEDRAAGARRAGAAAGDGRGTGGPEHVSRGLRDGRCRGGRLRRAAGFVGSFGPRRGHADARRRGAARGAALALVPDWRRARAGGPPDRLAARARGCPRPDARRARAGGSRAVLVGGRRAQRPRGGAGAARGAARPLTGARPCLRTSG
jgi:glycosyltransferase involved in cell wall biosynthesis